MPKNVDPGPSAYEVVANFQEVVRKFYQRSGDGYAYSSGYLGSILVDLIDDVPKARRQRIIDQLSRQIKEFEDKYLIECLSSNAKG